MHLFKINYLLLNNNQSMEKFISTIYFVDKTLLIRQLFLSKINFILFTRPRGWGKSLNLDMIKCFIEIGKYEENKKYFENTLISFEQKIIKQHAGKWPVIFLSLNALFHQSQFILIRSINQKITKCFQDHIYLLQYLRSKIKSKSSQAIHESYELNLFQKFLLGSADYNQIYISLQFLSSKLFQYHNRQVIILVDQYDSLFNQAAQKPQMWSKAQKQITTLVRLLENATTNQSKIVYKTILAGTLPMAKMQARSLVHFSHFGAQTKEFSQFFGFLEYEVDQILLKFTQNKKAQLKKLLKQSYNGYKNQYYTLYHPSSIFNCLRSFNKSNKQSILNNWAIYGNTLLLENEFKKLRIRPLFDKLMEKGEIKCKLDFQNAQLCRSEIQLSQNNLLVLLFHQGYITQGQESQSYIIPNDQIKKLCFQGIFKIWYQKVQNDDIERKHQLMLKSFQNCKQFQRVLNKQILSKIGPQNKNQDYFHCLIGGAFQMMELININATHQVSTEQKNSKNKKMDNIFFPFQGKSQTVIIHQYKICLDNTQQKIQISLNKGLLQVYSNNYLEYAVQQKFHNNHWRFFKVRVIVFFKQAQNTWKNQIVQYNHSFNQASKLCNDLKSFKNLDIIQLKEMLEKASRNEQQTNYRDKNNEKLSNSFLRSSQQEEAQPNEIKKKQASFHKKIVKQQRFRIFHQLRASLQKNQIKPKLQTE